MSFKERLREFVGVEVLGFGDATRLSEDESLISRGLIDSLALMKIVTFIEVETAVHVPDAEVIPANFESICSIDSMVSRLKGESRT